MAIRKGSQNVRIYNDGLVVYLYDEAQLERLRAMGGSAVVTGSDVRDEADELRNELVAKRMIVCYELFSDDSVHCEVIVGKALTPKERRGRSWIKVQKALLALPSGELRIESPNSCRFDDESPGDEGQTISVPAGEYLVSLFRVDPNADDEDGEDWDDDEDSDESLGEVIVLTPIAEAKTPKKWDPFLTWAGATGAEALRLPATTVEDGHFRGSVLRDSAWVFTDASPQILRTIGVDFGDVIDVEIDGKVQRALYSGTLSEYGLANYFRLGKHYDSELTPLHATLMYHDRQRKTVLTLDSWGGGSTPAGSKPRRISLHKRDERLLPRIDDARLGSAEKLDQGGVRTPILLASPHCILLDLSEELRTRLGDSWKDPLRMSYGGVTREVQLSNTVLLERDRFVQAIGNVAAEDVARVQELEAELDAIMQRIAECTTMADKGRLWVEREERSCERHLLQVPSERRPELPVYGSLAKHPVHADRGVLWLTPLIGGAFFQDFCVGDYVELQPIVPANSGG